MRTIPQMLMLIFLCWVTDVSAQETVTMTFYFDSNESNLKTTISQRLQNVDIDRVQSAAVIGHTDSVGSDSYNLRLGMRRANAVKKELSSILTGVEIEVTSEGESQPISDRSNAENRRAELKLYLMKPRTEPIKEPTAEEPKQEEPMTELADNSNVQYIIRNMGMLPMEGTLPKDAQPPVLGQCGVHFSGLLMAAEFDPMWFTKIYEDDNYSEYVGAGEYPSCTKAMPEACRSTFDGIAVDAGTRVIIYSKPNFKGDVLLDITGPAIVNNMMHQSAIEERVMADFSDAELQQRFPQEVRIWSKSNMNMWQVGSLKIICAGE